jgi:uncharacterized YigZ family protein
MGSDQYMTIAAAVKGILFKEKNSKFLGYAYPVESEEEIKIILEELRSQHKGVNHICYAWQIGVETTSFRINDDGEPNNSAGMPIYGQIQSFGLTNILVAVARYFGGTKLGVGGLISAYRQTAQLALEESKLIKKTLRVPLVLEFDYSGLSKVMRIVKKRTLQIDTQRLENRCEITLRVPKSKMEELRSLFLDIKGLSVHP